MEQSNEKEHSIQSSSRGRGYPIKYVAQLILEQHRVVTNLMGMSEIVTLEFPATITYHAQPGEVEKRLQDLVRDLFSPNQTYIIYYVIKVVK